MHSWTIIHHFLEWDSSPIARISQLQSLARSPGNSRSTCSDERQYGQWLRADHCGWRDTLWPQNWQSKVSLIMINIENQRYIYVKLYTKTKNVEKFPHSLLLWFYCKYTISISLDGYSLPILGDIWFGEWLVWVWIEFTSKSSESCIDKIETIDSTW